MKNPKRIAIIVSESLMVSLFTFSWMFFEEELIEAHFFLTVSIVAVADAKLKSIALGLFM